MALPLWLNKNMVSFISQHSKISKMKKSSKPCHISKQAVSQIP